MDTGRSGEIGNLVAKSETVTIQGRFEHGSIHAQAISHPDGRNDFVGPPGPPPPPGGPIGPPPPERALKHRPLGRERPHVPKRKNLMKALLLSGLTLALLTGGALARRTGLLRRPLPVWRPHRHPRQALRHHLHLLLALRRLS